MTKVMSQEVRNAVVIDKSKYEAKKLAYRMISLLNFWRASAGGKTKVTQEGMGWEVTVVVTWKAKEV